MKKQKLSKDLNEGEIAKTSLLLDITTTEANESVLDDAFKSYVMSTRVPNILLNQSNIQNRQGLNILHQMRQHVLLDNRYIEKKDMLECIKGGNDGAIFGVWEYMSKNASKEQLENLMLVYKKGKSMEKLNVHFNESLRGEIMKEAVASKFQLSLS